MTNGVTAAASEVCKESDESRRIIVRAPSTSEHLATRSNCTRSTQVGPVVLPADALPYSIVRDLSHRVAAEPRPPFSCSSGATCARAHRRPLVMLFGLNQRGSQNFNLRVVKLKSKAKITTRVRPSHGRRPQASPGTAASRDRGSLRTSREEGGEDGLHHSDARIPAEAG